MDCPTADFSNHFRDKLIKAALHLFILHLYNSGLWIASFHAFLWDEIFICVTTLFTNDEPLHIPCPSYHLLIIKIKIIKLYYVKRHRYGLSEAVFYALFL